MDVIWEGPQRAFIRHVDLGDGTHAVVAATIDDASFFRGREFRTFHEFSIPTGAHIVLRAVTPVNVLLQEFSVEIDAAKLKVEWYSGGTASGTWSTTLPIFRTNSTTTVDTSYSPQVVMTTGGDFTGGTKLDVFSLDAGIKKAAAGTGGGETNKLGMPPGTYFIRLTNTDGTTCTGVFKALWDER